MGTAVDALRDGAWRPCRPGREDHAAAEGAAVGEARVAMMQLFQTEWCPSSRRVRQRLTELGVDYVARQVAVDKAERRALIAASGSDVIPALLLDDGTPITGVDAILAYLDEHFAKPPGAEAQRAKAEKIRRDELQEALSALHAPANSVPQAPAKSTRTQRPAVGPWAWWLPRPLDRVLPGSASAVATPEPPPRRTPRPQPLSKR